MSDFPHRLSHMPSCGRLLCMETIAEPIAPFRSLKFSGAVVLILISSACLTLQYVQERWFIRIFRIVLGLGLPWIVARLFARRSYWLRLGLSYLGVMLSGLILLLIWPFISLFLMDAGLM